MKCGLSIGLLSASYLLWSAIALSAAEETTVTADRWALVIGINDYQAAGRLEYCREDAQALGKALVEGGGYSTDRIVVLTDGGAAETMPTRGNIRRRVEQFARLAGPEDTVLVFFSGHGMMAEGAAYLMAVDSDRDPANAVALDWLKERLEACPARDKVLVLDVCHAGSAKDVGGIAKDVGGIAPSLAAGARGLAVLSSCLADEISYVDEKRGHGVFTARLLEAVSGAGDADGDKAVTVSEAFTFVKRSMTDWCLATGRLQTPAVYGGDLASAVVLATVGGDTDLVARAEQRLGEEVSKEDPSDWDLVSVRAICEEAAARALNDETRRRLEMTFARLGAYKAIQDGHRVLEAQRR